MDVREKLVEIMEDLGCNNEYCKDCEFCNDIDGCVHRRKEIIADRLIANGVTVREWISVEDELPEDNSDVLAYSRSGEESRIYPACYSNGVWFDCVFNAPATDTTTHWMPLPSTEGIEDDT